MSFEECFVSLSLDEIIKNANDDKIECRIGLAWVAHTWSGVVEFKSGTNRKTAALNYSQR